MNPSRVNRHLATSPIDRPIETADRAGAKATLGHRHVVRAKPPGRTFRERIALGVARWPEEGCREGSGNALP